MFNMNGGELLLLGLLAVLLLGPNRLPEYAAKLAQLVRSLRDLAEGAKGQLRQEMGPAFDDIDWQQLDPRQYDPRRIVREALTTPGPEQKRAEPVPARERGTRGSRGDSAGRSRRSAASSGRERKTARRRSGSHDPGLPTPFDSEAT